MFGLGNKKKEEEMKEGLIFSTQSENQESAFSEELQKYKEEVDSSEQQIEANEPTLSEGEPVGNENTGILEENPVEEKHSMFSGLFGKKEKTESEESVKDEVMPVEEVGVEVKEKHSMFSGLFGKKEKTESEESVKEEATSNIFEDFASNDALKEDVKKLEENKNKDSTYYISLISNIIKTFNTIFLVLVIVLVSYVYIQKREQPLGFSFLNPICSFIIGEIPYEKYGNCEGVKVMKKAYAKDIEITKENQYTGIASAIGDIYARENFLFSREVTFLIDRSRNRVAPLKVLAQFDKRKNQFEGIEKSRIKCFNMNISEESILSMSCEAYSADWERGFIGFDANKSSKTLEGTSITAANSFLNFLEMNAPEFALMNRQKNFIIESVTSEGFYTKKTLFKIELKFDRTSL